MSKFDDDWSREEREAVRAIAKLKHSPFQKPRAEYPKNLMTATFCLIAFLCAGALTWGFMYGESTWGIILQLLLILVGGEAFYLCTSAYQNKDNSHKSYRKRRDK